MPNELRPELEPLPARMRDLPVDDRGYVVPWFVDWIDGKPEFRAMDRIKWIRAIREHLCWVCGGRLGVWQVFVLGPMCGINRTTSEPPCHLECAQWSARNCPFLARPHAVRRVAGMEETACPAGIMIKRNPGVTLLWKTKTFEIFDDGQGAPLIRIGPQEGIEWYAEGRPATREEVAYSVDTGLPYLEELAQAECPKAVAELRQMAELYTALYPATPAAVQTGA